MKNKKHYCPYCGEKLPIQVRKSLSYEIEITGQATTLIIKECPNGCMHKEAIRKGLIKAEM